MMIEHNASCADYRPAYRCSACMKAAILQMEGTEVLLRAALDRDRTGLANALAAIVKSAKGRDWLLLGRGPYMWDDDDYRKETRWALEEIIDIAEKALYESGALATDALRTITSLS